MRFDKNPFSIEVTISSAGGTVKVDRLPWPPKKML
jgi:hypothetical protein